jgi:hypothetical protein
VHQGGYATGTPNYTTPYGNSLASQAGMGAANTGYPAGTVNRQAFTGVGVMGSSQYLYDRGRWGSCASIGLNQPSCLNIAAKGVIDPATRKLTLLVEIYYTADAEEITNKLTVAMLQNEILGPQTGGAANYPEMMVGGQYRHMHMLRDYVTATQWGMSVSPTTEGTFWSHTFTYNIPEQINNVPVVLENLEFVVFVAENNKTIISGTEAIIDDNDAEYTITTSEEEHGSIVQRGDNVFPVGTQAIFTITPDEGYKTKEVFVNELPMNMAEATEFKYFVFNDFSLRVTFTTAYTITASAGENGAISPMGETEYMEGNSATYTFTPDADYKIDEVLIDNVPVEIDLDATSYTFPAVDKDYTIHVTFKLIDGIKDVNGMAISIAPNPVNDQLYITGMYDKLEIFSISGQLLTTAYSQPTIDVNSLAKGIYFIKIQSNSQICTFKIIK